MKYIKLLAIILFPLILLLTWWNKSIVVTDYTISNKIIPNNFADFRIVQVSDLHNATFGKNNNKLIDKIKNENPDIIVITGDMVDSRRTDFDIALEFIKQVTNIAPVYYVIGNHETRVYDDYLALENQMIELGVHVLRNQSEYIEKNNESIQIIGVDDPDMYTNTNEPYEILNNQLIKLNDPDKFTILLSHRPELFDMYTETNMNLVFSGHAHGGQVRLPFVGGLIAPHQGLLPEYDAGLFTNGETNLIVSRGLGNSLFPFRINNRPELIVATLQSGN